MWRYSQCRAHYTRGGGSESHDIVKRQAGVRDLVRPVGPMVRRLLNDIDEGVLKTIAESIQSISASSVGDLTSTRVPHGRFLVQMA